MVQLPPSTLETEVTELLTQLDAEVTARGVTYAHIAQKAGLTREVVSLVLRRAGQYQPKLATVARVAKALGFEVRIRLMRIGPH